MFKKEWMLSILILSLAVLLFGFFRFTYLQVWGFRLNRYDLKDVIVMTKNHSYMITNHEDVVKIAKAASSMNIGAKETQNLSYTPEHHGNYIKIMLQLKDFSTYGGQIWRKGSDFVIEGNGNYYRSDYHEMKNTIEASLKNAELLN